jgi:hypothetical protein|tara:strand:- start:302 stop:595 length:294 start_codon:yes stop_codon:yes gene_type:complete
VVDKDKVWTFKDLKKIPLVLVTWQDITTTHNGWFDSVEDLKVASIKTPGWILVEDEECVKMISTIGFMDNEAILGFDTIIPTGCIKNITVLRKHWWK